MKLSLTAFLVTLACVTGTISTVKAQHVYQIRADSVRIYNVCDTAELIIENRTRGVSGYLFNKGGGRTEFRKIDLVQVGGSKLAIAGQDTIDLAQLSGVGGIDTIYRAGDSIRYVKKGIAKGVYAPVLASADLNLQAVTTRGSSTTQNILFNAPTANPSNGLMWQYNTDSWRMYVESLQDKPSGNLIFEAKDDIGEGWVFRHVLYSPLDTTSVLSMGRDRFLYMGDQIWHAGNHAAGALSTKTFTTAQVPASIETNASGHVTAISTRMLTPADIGALSLGDGIGRIARTTNPTYLDPHTGNLDSIANSGIFHIGVANNRPSTQPAFLFAGGNNTGASNFKFQLLGAYSTEDEMFYRQGNPSATWGNWYQVASRQWTDASFIRNGTAAQTANFNITGTGTIGTTISQLLLSNNSNAGLTLIGGSTAPSGGRGGQIVLFGGTHPSNAGQITFHAGLGSGGTQQNEVMRIMQDGKIGIGTMSPSAKLTLGITDVIGEVGRIGFDVGPDQRAYLGAYRHTAVGQETDLFFGTMSTERMRIKHNGYVGIGTNAPASLLHVNGNVTATAYYQSSLRSLKKEIQPFAGSALRILGRAKVRSFIFKADTTGHRSIGFIADEVPAEIATPGNNGVDQANVVGLLVKAIQELKAEKDAMEAQLKAKNEALEARLSAIEALLKSK